MQSTVARILSNLKELVCYFSSHILFVLLLLFNITIFSCFIYQPQLKANLIYFDVSKFAAYQIDFYRPTLIPSKKGESSHDYYFNNKLPGT